MRPSRLAVMLGLACTLAVAVAAPGGTRNFDATYKSDMAGGPWLCPEEGHGFTVTHGQFSIPWDIRVGQGNDERAETVAHIEGTLPAAGTTTATSVAVSPVPAAVAHDARQYHVSLAPLDGTTFEVTARKAGDELEIAISTELRDGKCSADFAEDGAATPPPDDTVATTEVDCTTKPYAVAAWTTDKPYGEGAYTQVPAGDEAASVYRCAHGCAAGRSPADNDDTWTLVGRCAASALPAQGAAAWDTTYELAVNGAFTDDWRCPVLADHDKLAVSHGKLTIPWRVRTYDKHDTESRLDVGHIDVVTRADGTSAVQPVVTATSLPRDLEYLTQGRKVPVTIDYLKSLRPTVTFYLEKSMRDSSYGVGRRGELVVTGHDNGGCTLSWYATDFKQQQFLEKDGWRSDCNDDQVWDSNKSYDFGQIATVVVGGVRRPYTCEASPRCDAGVRPDRSDRWRKENRCR